MSNEIHPIHNGKVPDFPEVWDSVIQSPFSNCMRLGYWKNVRHLVKPGGNIHLIFGACIAKGLEIARKGYYQKHFSQKHSISEGIIAASIMWEAEEGDAYIPNKGSGANKTYAALVDALDSYFERWPLDGADIVPLELPNGDLFIEKTFDFKVPGTSHPITGQPLIYAGRLDMLGRWKETGLIIGVDEKTSGQLGASWEANWPMRGQITGYCKGSDETYGYKTRDFHIRGMGILKNDITFAESLQNRPQWRIDRWLEQLRRNMNRAADAWRKMYDEQARIGFTGENMEYHWDTAEDNACAAYGGCDMMDLCRSQYPERFVHYYETKQWNPLEEKQ